MNCVFRLCPLMVALAATPAGAVTIYQCEDEFGSKTFQERCPPGTKSVQEQRYGAEPAPTITPDLPELTLYSVPDCDTCKLTRDFLGERDIPFNEINVSDDVALQAELKQRAGALRVPTVMVGETVVAGYNKTGLADALRNAGFDLGEAELPAATGTATEVTAESPDTEATEVEAEAATTEAEPAE